MCLLPEQAAFGQSRELKEKLGELRNTSLAVLVVVNVLWLTFMLTVMNQGKKLEVAGSDFASVAFLLIYFLVSMRNYTSISIYRFFYFQTDCCILNIVLHLSSKSFSCLK